MLHVTRTSAGRLLQSRGSAVANDCSPAVTHHDGLTSRRLEVDERLVGMPSSSAQSTCNYPPTAMKLATWSHPDEFWLTVIYAIIFSRTGTFLVMCHSSRRVPASGDQVQETRSRRGSKFLRDLQWQGKLWSCWKWFSYCCMFSERNSCSVMNA